MIDTQRCVLPTNIIGHEARASFFGFSATSRAVEVEDARSEAIDRLAHILEAVAQHLEVLS